MTAGAIADRFACSWPTTTRHLQVLEKAAIVKVEKRGRERVYRLDAARLLLIAGEWLSWFRDPREEISMSTIAKVLMQKFYRQAAAQPEKLPWHSDEPDALLRRAVEARAARGLGLNVGCGAECPRARRANHCVSRSAPTRSYASCIDDQ